MRRNRARGLESLGFPLKRGAPLADALVMDRPSAAAPARLVYALETLASCGTTDLVAHLVGRLDRTRFAPEVVTLRPPPAADRDREAEAAGRARFSQLGVPTQRVGLDPLLPFWRRLRPLVGWLRQREASIVHAQSRPEDLWSIWAGLLARTPVRIYSRQSTYGGLTLDTRARYALTARAASRVVAVSEAVRNHLRTREGVPGQRIALIHDGIDLDAVDAAAPAAETRARLGIPPGVPLVGWVAALTSRKGQCALVDAAPRVWRTFPDTRFLLVGDGPERQNLARRIASLERPEQVRLLGWREDARDLIAAFDVFVLPSLWEGLNLSLLTACALGRGVVATHLRSNREIVEPGVTGLLPAPERAVLEADRVDPDRLGQAIGALLADPDGRRRMGEAAARRTRARFGAEMMAARHEELYRRLLHRSARGQGAALGGAPWRARGSRATAAGDGGL